MTSTNIDQTNEDKVEKKERKVRSNVKRVIEKTNVQLKGQFFTTDDKFHDQMFQFIQNRPDCILEPSVGRGDLVAAMTQRFATTNGPVPNWCLYEIDATVPLLPDIDKTLLEYVDFLDDATCVHRKFATIIGNPPYVRVRRPVYQRPIADAKMPVKKKSNKTKMQDTNLYILFIRKCMSLLEPNGELIFIVPSDLFKRDWSASLLQEMWTNGRFTHVYHPHSDRLFTSAGIDTLLFRYQINDTTQIAINSVINSVINSTVVYNNAPTTAKLCGGSIITFNNCTMEQPNETLSMLTTVHVGMASGRESVLQNDKYGKMSLLDGENNRKSYIFIDPLIALTDRGKGWSSWDDVPDEVRRYLEANKPALLSRKFRRFDEHNWYEWGAARNFEKVVTHWGEPCVYLYTMRRKPLVAFAGTVEFFGAQLLMILGNNLQKTVDYLNSDAFRLQFTFAGRFCITQGQLQSYLESNHVN